MDAEEIKSIMRQFKHGAADSEWKQFIKSIKITNIHGWTGQEIAFNFPVVAIVGENGIGKSTFLKASVCAYKNKNGQTFYPSKMFVSTRWDATGLQNAIIEYKVRNLDERFGIGAGSLFKYLDDAILLPDSSGSSLLDGIHRKSCKEE